MIKIISSTLKLLKNIKNPINPQRFEEINGENTLDFTVVLDEKTASYVNENNLVELDNDYFDIAYYSKDMNEDGTATMDVECEHVSYRLNDPVYDLETFTFMGTPVNGLTAILAGTGFTVGAIEYTEVIVYSAQEKKSRRAILMEFVALLGGEVDFDKFTVSIVQKRGSRSLKIFTKGKNIKIVSKIYDKRTTPAKISYTCTPIILPNKDVNLGDDVLLIQTELGIQDNLRVVRINYNPTDSMEKEIEIANYIDGLEDQIYRIENKTVTKGKLYNGVKISAENGFQAIRSDNKVITTMNATEGFKLETDKGAGLVPVFYVGEDGIIHAVGLVISTSADGERIELTPDNIFKIYSSESGNPQAFEIRYDTNGSGDPEEATNRVYVATQNSYALKIESNDADISLEAKGTNKKIWLVGLVNAMKNLDMNNNSILNVSNMYTAAQVNNIISNHIANYHSS